MLFYCTDRILREGSGELYHTIGVISSFINRGEDVTVLIDKANKHIFVDNWDRRKNVKFIFVDSGSSSKGVLRALKFYYFVNKFLSSNFKGIDLVYTRDTVYTFLLSTLPNRIKRRVVTEINGVARIEANSFFKSAVYNILDRIKSRFVWKQALINLCVADGIKNFYSEHLSSDIRFHVIHNGLNGKFYSTVQPKILKSTISMIFVANFTSWQRLDELCNIVLSNRSYFTKNDIRIDLYGSGPALDLWVSLVGSSDLSSIIQFKGVLKQSDMADVFPRYNFGLILDDRYYNELPLFSPLKYYEYLAYRLPTLYINKFGKLTLDGCYGINPENVIDVLEGFLKSTPCLNAPAVRTWDNVVDEFYGVVSDLCEHTNVR